MSDPRLPTLPNGEIDWEKVHYGVDYCVRVRCAGIGRVFTAEEFNKVVAAHYRALGAKEEREACAKLAEDQEEWFRGGVFSERGAVVLGDPSGKMACLNISAAIRKRGGQT